MMDLTRLFSMPFVLLSFHTGAHAADAAAPCAADPANSFAVLSQDEHAARGFPAFCSIPATPTDVRTADAFKAAVLDSRRAGAEVAQDASASTFSLQNTPGFETDALRAAAAPPPMISAGEPDTDAFVRSARALVAPPARPR